MAASDGDPADGPPGIGARASKHASGILRPSNPPAPRAEAPVQLFVTAIQYPVQFGLAILVAGIFVGTFLRAAMSPERRTGGIGWVRAITGPNAKFFFGLLFVGWAVVSGLLIPSFPNTANSPYGALALISLFAGFFIMMGLLWAVIGE
jgi:hypothetical protein